MASQVKVRHYDAATIVRHCASLGTHCSARSDVAGQSDTLVSQVNIRRYNVVCGPGQCEWQEQATGRLQNWQLQDSPDPQLVEVSTLPPPS